MHNKFYSLHALIFLLYLDLAMHAVTVNSNGFFMENKWFPNLPRTYIHSIFLASNFDWLNLLFMHK